MVKNCIVTSVDPGGMTGGNKAKSDIEFFCKQDLDFNSLHLVLYSKKDFWKKVTYFLWGLKRQVNSQTFDNYIIQYPIIDDKIFDRFIRYIFKKKNAKVYLIIHDIKSLQNNDVEIKQKEINLFNKVDGLVVHNQSMKKWLEEQGVKNKMSILEIFDYDNPQQFQSFSKYDGKICFPGNLFKSTFLQKNFLQNHKIDIYGPNKLDNYPANVIYKGQYSPEELPKHLNENFGLIWDGNSIKSCSGHFGEYLKYNNPHKTSLFISTGIPIIVWKKAAIAKLVNDYNIGIVIDNLRELDSVLDNVDLDQYKELKKNTEILGKKLREGFFIKRALRELLYE